MPVASRAKGTASRKAAKQDDPFRLLFENNPLPMWVYDSVSLKFLEVNQAALEHYGYSRAEMLKMSILDIRPREDVAGTLKVLEQKRSALRHAGLWRHRVKSGDIIDVEITSHKITFAGRPARLVVAQDVTARRRTEQLLEESRAHLAAVIATAMDGIITLDDRQRIVMFNAAAEAIFRTSAAEVIGKPLDRFIPKPIRGGHPDLIQEFGDNGTTKRRMGIGDLPEIICLRADREEFPAEISISSFESDGRKYFTAIVRDVSRRKHGQDELRISEKRYRTLAEAAHDLIIIINPRGRIEYVNSFAAAQFGRQPHEFIDARIQEFFPPEMAGRQWTNIKKVLETGEEIYVEASTPLAGNLLWLGTRLVPMRNDSGEVEAVLAVARDITKQRLADEALGRTMRDYQHLFERANDAVLIIEPHGELILDANAAACATYGFTREELIGTSLKKLTKDVRRGEEKIREVLKTGSFTDFETVQYDREGRELYFLINASVIEYRGRPAVLSLNHNITERKHAEEKIRRQVAELEALYRGGLAISQSLDPKAIGEQVITGLAEWMDWHHAAVRLRREGSDEVELLAYSDAKRKTGPLNADALRARQVITRIGQGMAGWVIEHGETVRMSDLENDERYVRTFPGMHSGLYVPMKIGGRTLGCVSVESPDVDAFSQDDERLLTTIGVQAAVALENARLYAESQRRAAEFTALYEITRDLAAQTDVSILLQTIAERAAALLGVNGGGVYLYDPQTNDLEMVAATHATIPVGRRLQIGEGMAGRVAESREPLVVADYQTWDGRSGQFNGVPIYAVAEVPMIYGGELLGVLVAETVAESKSLTNDLHRKFTDLDVRVLSLFASAAAGAVYNARLIEETRRNAAQLLTINTLGRTLAETLDLNQIYERLARAALTILSDTAALSISVVDAERGLIVPVYDQQDGRTLDVASLASAPLAGTGMQSRVASSGKAVVFEDPPAEDEYGGGPVGGSGVCLPMSVHGKVVGVLQLHSPSSGRYSLADADLLGLIANTAAIAIENARLFAQTERRVKQLSSLHVIDAAISSSTDINMTLRIVLEHVLAQLHMDAADVLLLNPHTLNLTYALGRGFRSSKKPRLTLRLGESQAGTAALERRRIFIPDLSEQEHVFAKPELFAGEDFVSFGCIPLIVKGEVKGVLEVFNRSRIDPDQEWLNFLELLAGQMAIAIDNSTLFDELQRSNLELTLSYDSALEGLSRALDLHDAEPEGHALQLTQLTVRLASAVGVRDASIVQIRHGALLHDIGQVGVPDNILKKQGSLDEAEWAVVRQHPQYAYDILMPIASLRPALDIPYAHHERWDGSGYPRGLKRETIPRAARIFAVVDVYSAMTRDRPYRKALSKEAAVTYLREQSGRHFDPEIVEAFLRMLPEIEA